MTDEINEKVINLFQKHNKFKDNLKSDEIRFFEGFHYVKVDRDKNGKKFNYEYLKEYAEGCHYIVRVMRKVNDEVVLYNYSVSNEDLYKFMEKFENNTLNGIIIEIDKYFPEDLA